MKKYKATGCARFFVVMLVLAPLAYVGASYYNGEDPIENIKGLFGNSESGDRSYNTPSEPSTTPPARPEQNDDTNASSDEVEQLKDVNSKLVEENKYLKIQIQTLEKELDALKNPPAEDQ